MLDYIDFISQFLKFAAALLTLGFIVIILPAGVLLAKDEFRETMLEKHQNSEIKKPTHHRRPRNADNTYILRLVKIHRENLALREALTFEFARVDWSI